MRTFVAPLCILAALAAPAAADDGLSRAEISKLGKAATVYIENGRGSGSGFCVHSSGLFVTNEHVVAGAEVVTVVIDPDLKTQKVVKAHILRADKDLDLALLRVDDVKDTPTLSLGSVEKIAETMQVVAFGFPFGKLLDSDKDAYPAVSVNMGSVTALREKAGALHRIQVDAVLNPGNSGGPVLGPDGKVVGVVVAGVRGTGVNFVIPVSHLATFLAKPEFDFQPPAATRAAMNTPVEFHARAVALVPGGKPLDLELVLTGEDGKARTFPMTKEGDDYRVRAVPLPPSDAPVQLRAAVAYPSGSVTGLVADRALTVGGKPYKFSDLSGLRWQPAAAATAADGKPLDGAVAGLDNLEVDLGKEVVRLKLDGALSARFERVGGAGSVACAVVVKQDGKEVTRLSRTLTVDDPAAEVARDPGAALDPLRPPTLDQDTVVRKLPDAADDVVVGGGGRYLIFHLPKTRQLAVFDAAEAKVVKYLPVAEDTVHMAAGLDKLVVALPSSNVLQRYDLATFKRDVAVPNPLTGRVTRLLMGSDTRGPLAVGMSGGKTGLSFLDPLTFKETDYQLVGNAGFLDFGSANAEARISADGDIITGWSLAVSPTGLTSYVRQGKTYTQHYEHKSVGSVLPSADGRILFTRDGPYSPEAKQLGKGESSFGHSVWTVPSLQGAYHLTFTQTGDRDKAGPTLSVAVHLAGDSRAVATLPSKPEYDGLVNWQTGQSQMFDKHVFLIPGADLLVFVPAADDQLILQRFNLVNLLDKAGVDYLFVASQPVTQAVKGSTYSYPLSVKSKKGGVKVKLVSGPPGMDVTADGRTTWAVPAVFADPTADVILSVTDDSGQEVFHSFKVTVVAKDGSAP